MCPAAISEQISDLTLNPSPALTDVFGVDNAGRITYKTSGTQLLSLIQTNIQITESQVTNLVTDLAGKSPLAGSSSLVTVGTVTSGTWNASIIAGQYGGTGVANTGLTINLASGATGKVLASDSSGNATWQTLSSIGVTSISATAPITASASTGAVTIGINNATTTTVGTASFPSTYFSVSSGAVTPNNFTITASTGLSGGGALTLGGSTSIAIANTTVTASSYGSSTAIPTFTVNAQGQLTAASTAAVVAPAGTLTGTTLASNVVTSSLTTIGTLVGGSVPFSLVTGTVPVNQGGTGQTTYTNGQILIGNTTGNTLTKSTLTQGTGIVITNSTGSITIAADTTALVSTITGTANQVLVNGTSATPTSGAITLTLPQNIATTSAVQLGSLKLNTSSAPTATTILTSSVTTARNANIVVSGNSMDGNSSTDGVAIMMAHNASSNRQLAIVDSTLTASSSSNGMIRIIPNSGIIDYIGTDVSTLKQITIGNSTGGIYSPGPLSVGTNSVSGNVATLFPVSTSSVGCYNILGSFSSTPGGFSVFSGYKANFTYSPAADSSACYYVGHQAGITYISPSGSTLGICADFYASSTYSSNVGTINNAIGFYFDGGSSGAGNIPNAYGGYFATPNFGTIKTGVFAQSLVIGNGLTTAQPPTNGALFYGNSAFGPVTAAQLAPSQLNVGTYNQFQVDSSGDLSISTLGSSITAMAYSTSASNSNGATIMYGWAFSFSGGYVTQLGLNDSVFGSGTRNVGWYTAGGALLLSAAVAKTDSLNGQFRYHTITSTYIPAGNYVIGVIVINGDTDFSVPSGQTFASAITFSSGRNSGVLGSTTLPTTDPTINTSSGTYPMATFSYTTVATNFNISSSTGNAYTLGTLGIGGTSPTQALQIFSGSILTQSASGATYEARFRNNTGNNSVSISAGGVYGTSDVFSSANLTLGSYASSAYVAVITITSTKSVLLQQATLATTATDGFMYVPTCAGAPTGVPTAQTGVNPMIYDITNNKIWVYNGSWRGIVVT